MDEIGADEIRLQQIRSFLHRASLLTKCKYSVITVAVPAAMTEAAATAAAVVERRSSSTVHGFRCSHHDYEFGSLAIHDFPQIGKAILKEEEKKITYPVPLPTQPE